MNTELKGCPFCGGKADFDNDDNGWNWIFCTSCQATTNQMMSAMEDCRPLLAEQWNTRFIEKLAKPMSDDEILKLADDCHYGMPPPIAATIKLARLIEKRITSVK